LNTGHIGAIGYILVSIDINRQIPFLVMNGISWTVAKDRGCCGRYLCSWTWEHKEVLGRELQIGIERTSARNL